MRFCSSYSLYGFLCPITNLGTCLCRFSGAFVFSELGGCLQPSGRCVSTAWQSVRLHASQKPRRQQTHSVSEFRRRPALWVFKKLFTDVIIFFGEANQERATGHGLAYFSFTPRLQPRLPRLHCLSLLILWAWRDGDGTDNGRRNCWGEYISVPVRHLAPP